MCFPCGKPAKETVELSARYNHKRTLLVLGILFMSLAGHEFRQFYIHEPGGELKKSARKKCSSLSRSLPAGANWADPVRHPIICSMNELGFHELRIKNRFLCLPLQSSSNPSPFKFSTSTRCGFRRTPPCSLFSIR